MNISLPSFTIFSNFYEILGSCFYAFNQYIEFSVSPCTENNENNMSNVKPLKLIHTFALVGISNYTILNSTILSVLQFSRLIDILSENFWSWVDKIASPFVRFSNPQPPSNLGIQFYNNLHELLKHSSGTSYDILSNIYMYIGLSCPCQTQPVSLLKVTLWSTAAPMSVIIVKLHWYKYIRYRPKWIQNWQTQKPKTVLYNSVWPKL